MPKLKLHAIVKVFGLLVTICFLMSSCKYGTKEDNIEYPANYLTMENEPIDYEKLPKPVELYCHLYRTGFKTFKTCFCYLDIAYDL